jgi:hypothetical protein
MQSDPVPLKKISYRGGLVTFRIPAHWQEEYGQDGGGSFYEDSPDSPTFRLEVMTFELASTIERTDAVKALASISKVTGESPIEALPTGQALVCYHKTDIDRGDEIRITYWSIARVIPPHHVRIATFSYTLLAGQERDPRIQGEMSLLDAEVRLSVIWPELS